MRYSIFTLLMVFGWVSLAQSKKEQIRVLTNRVDSLNLVLNSERSDNSQRVEQLNRRVSELEENVRGLEIKLKEKDSENETNKKQIEELRELINVKSDSLNALQAEIDKLNPTSLDQYDVEDYKSVVKTNPVISAQSGTYKSVTIGTQVWMKENLNVSTFRNGDPIPEAKTAEEWQAAGEAKQPAWCYYDNDSKNGVKYGKLYNWYAVNDSRGLAPVGWHVPDNDEMFKLFKGKRVLSGKELKSQKGWYETIQDITCTNCNNWIQEFRRKNSCYKCKDTRVTGKRTDNGNGSNSSGFSALPGGRRFDFGKFENYYYLGGEGVWWCSNDDSKAWIMLGVKDPFLPDANTLVLYGNNDSVSFELKDKAGGCSVRLIKD